jgi:hypothetical protein
MCTSLAHPLYRLASTPLCEASSELLSELALIVWYADNAVAGLQSVLDHMEGGSELMLRRAIYLIDRLRRFPCITNEKAIQLKKLVAHFNTLKAADHLEETSRSLSIQKPEALAYGWGLDEDVTIQMKHVLQFQTRHYASSLGVKTGYSE